MGTIKSLASLYSKNQYLFWFIEKDSLDQVADYLNQYPEIINQPMTRDSKVLPLSRAVWRGNIDMVRLLIDRGANINQVSQLGQIAVLVAAKRDHIEILKLLIQKGADIDYQNKKTDLYVIQYAILGGFYDIAFYLYPAIKNKQFRTIQKYHQQGKKYRYRYVNYEMILNGLKQQISPQIIGDYLKKQKIIFKDPVIDPRQTWGNWLKRVSQFKAPPLVERDELPEELQPQNRKMGRLHHLLDSFISRGSRIKPSIYPSQARTEVDLSQQQMVRNNKREEVQSAYQ